MHPSLAHPGARACLIDTANLARHEPAVEKRLTVVSAEPDLAWLARDHEQALRAFALRLCRNSSDADDLVQDTLTRAVVSLSAFKPGTNARSWLLSILHHLFIDACRRKAHQGVGVELDKVANALAVDEPDPEPAWASVAGEDVDEALGQLDTGFREVYRLHAQGKSYEQIAQTLEIPRATVGTRLLRARKKLRALLFGSQETPES